MSSRKIWILVGCLIGGGVVFVGAIGALAFHYLAPVMGPMLAVRSEIVKVYPSSNPSVQMHWQNGRKTFQVSVAASFNPVQDSSAAQAMAGRIAQIVRDHYDLAGYDGITVVTEQRFNAGIVHAKTVRGFSFTVSAEAKP